ncbi:MAG: hypothetical protein ACRCUY_07875 [Thermoguttaceae bacterium]
MPKALCITSLVIAAIVFLIFTLNLLAGIPFGAKGGVIASIGMIVSSLTIGTFSVLTFLEIR